MPLTLEQLRTRVVRCEQAAIDAYDAAIADATKTEAYHIARMAADAATDAYTAAIDRLNADGAWRRITPLV